MKKTTLKITTFLLVIVLGITSHGQVGTLDSDGFGLFDTQSEGTWKVKLKDQVGGETLFLTVNDDMKVVWSSEINPGAVDDPSQLWFFSGHALNANNYYITSAVPDFGVIKADTSSDVTPDLIVGPAGEQDQMQMRKQAQIDSEYASNGEMPGQNAIFLADDRTGTPWESANNAIRVGVSPVVKDATIQLDGTVNDAMRFKFIGLLNTNNFNSNSIYVSSPVFNNLEIKGLTDAISQIELYSILGKRILSYKIKDQSEVSININSLSVGMYVIKMIGDKGNFTKKIIKQ